MERLDMDFFTAISELKNNKTICRNNFEYTIKLFPAINEFVIIVKYTKNDNTIESFWSGFEDALFTPLDIYANDWKVKNELQQDN
jgi:hypothetical protein